MFKCDVQRLVQGSIDTFFWVLCWPKYVGFKLLLGFMLTKMCQIYTSSLLIH